MKETERTWLDFDGNLFGQGDGSDFFVAEGRFQGWNTATGGEGEPKGDSDHTAADYAVIFVDNHGNYNGYWHDEWAWHVAPLMCQKPVQERATDSGNLLYDVYIPDTPPISNIFS